MTISSAKLKEAATVQAEIEKLQVRLSNILGNSAPATKASSVNGKREVSPETRAKIAAAQKARWASVAKTSK